MKIKIVSIIYNQIINKANLVYCCLTFILFVCYLLILFFSLITKMFKSIKNTETYDISTFATRLMMNGRIMDCLLLFLLALSGQLVNFTSQVPVS